MKTQLTSGLRKNAAPARSGEAGSIALVFVILMAIMMILIMAESRALVQLHGEVKCLEQQQIKRLNHSTATPADAGHPAQP